MTMIYTGSTISFQNNGKFHQAHQSHPKFQQIVEYAKVGDFATAAALVDIRNVVTKALSGTGATLVGDKVLYKGEAVSGLLSRRIVEMAREGFDATPLLLFLDNLMSNPSKRAVDELYGFLEASGLPITDDGHFLAYKSVRQDFKDHHSGTMDNSVGQIVSMERNRVDEDKDRTCSYGLHFAAHEYANQFGSHGRMVVLKINPRDVVAIPSDYNNQKGRCCRYEVIEEVERSDTKLVSKGFISTSKGDSNVTFDKSYEPQVDNYDDEDIWEEDWLSIITFVGEPKEFPVNKDVGYTLERKSNNKIYRGEFFFKNYDEKNDNLIFVRMASDGSVDRWVTIKDVSDWYIQRDLDLE